MQAKLEELEKYNYDPNGEEEEYLIVEGYKGENGYGMHMD